jgi:hypothetical protein
VLPQLQAIGPNNNNNQQQPALQEQATTRPGLPGFPPQAAPTVPNGNLVWVGLGGGGSG